MNRKNRSNPLIKIISIWIYIARNTTISSKQERIYIVNEWNITGESVINYNKEILV